MSTSTSPGEGSTLRPWHLFLVCALLAAATAVFVARDNSPENLVAISVAIVSAGFAGMAMVRVLAPLVSAEAAQDTAPVGGRARVGLEREKSLVLRSIKELEFDKAMGKVAEPDFTDMSGRLRARAIGLMKQLDETGGDYRGEIEREVRQRLEARGKVAVPPRGGSKAAAAVRTCGQCGASNDADARFCKSRGSRFEG
jgi:pyruvate/2-oxoacid:ferredoxin oxidoreductase beta subunit